MIGGSKSLFTKKEKLGILAAISGIMSLAAYMIKQYRAKQLSQPSAKTPAVETDDPQFYPTTQQRLEHVVREMEGLAPFSYGSLSPKDKIFAMLSQKSAEKLDLTAKIDQRSILEILAHKNELWAKNIIIRLNSDRKYQQQIDDICSRTQSLLICDACDETAEIDKSKKSSLRQK